MEETTPTGTSSLNEFERRRAAANVNATAHSLIGNQFLSEYYLIFEYRANKIGLATKNLAANAATTDFLVGSG
jgi:hypothetical protein